MQMEKVYISGTGRCGTTFLIKIFSFLGFDTGFTKENYKYFISENCNAGMERSYKCVYNVVKHPWIIENIDMVYNNPHIKIKYMIIPVRDLRESAKSRVKNGYHNGGFWNATDEESQLAFYNKIMANYIHIMVKYDIPTIFINFEKMITDKFYLYEILSPVLSEKNITFEHFCEIYDYSVTS